MRCLTWHMQPPYSWQYVEVSQAPWLPAPSLYMSTFRETQSASSKTKTRRSRDAEDLSSQLRHGSEQIDSASMSLCQNQASPHVNRALEMKHRKTSAQVPSTSTPRLTDTQTFSEHGKKNAKNRLLWALSICLAGISVLVALAWYFSQKYSGFSVTIFSQSVLTYAPTTVMLVLVAAWRQVDYGCKTTAPWIELSKGHATASRSMLLDYISTFQALSLWTSIRNGHITVSLGVVGFVLLKVATIASTGLLVLGPRTNFSGYNTTSRQKFDGTLYNSSDFSLLQDQSPAYTAYGLISAGLDQPAGTTAEAAYASFDLPNNLSENSSFSIAVDALFPDLVCQHANISIEMQPNNSTDINPKHQIRLSSSSCDSSPGPIYALNPAQFVCPPRQLSGTVKEVVCQNEDETGNSSWKLITMTDIRYRQTFNGSGDLKVSERVTPLNSSTEIAGISSILCKSSYSSGSLNVSGTAASTYRGLHTFQIPGTVSGPLQDFTGADLNSMVDMVLSAASDMFGTVTDNTYATEYPNTMLKLMAAQVPNGYEDLLFEDKLMETASLAYKHVAVQVMNRHLSRDVVASVPMHISRPEKSLQITELSAWLMFGVFMGTLCTSLVLLFSKSNRTLSIRAQTMLEFAQVASRSTSLHTLFVETGQKSELDMAKALADYSFTGSYDGLDNSFAINAVPMKGTSSSEKTARDTETLRWWKQLTISRWFMSLTFLYAILAICALEVLQRLSRRRDGITAVSFVDGFWRTSITHYLPALFMLLLATMFNCLDFNVLLLYPYHQLKGSMPSAQLERRPPLRQLPVVSYWHAIINLNYAMIGSSTAAFVGGLLTIVVSGLYSIETFSLPTTAGVMALDVMNASWVDSISDDGGAAIVLSLVENLNLSYPQGTYDELYLPQLELSTAGNQSSQNSQLQQLIEVPLTAYRGNLSCETAASGAYNVSIDRNRIQQTATVSSTYPLPPNCLRGGPGGNGSDLTFQYTFSIALNDTETYLAKVLNLHVGPYDDITGTSAGELVQANQPDNPPGCPSLAFIYGYLGTNELAVSSSNGDSIAVQVCYQEVHSVDVNATFQGPDMKLPSANLSLTVEESSTKKLFVPASDASESSTTTNETAFPFRIQSHFDNSLAFFNDSDNPFDSGSTSISVVDRFFQGVFFGSSAMPLGTLKLATQSDFDQVQEGILRLYRRYMAQAMSRKMRLSTDSLSEAEKQDRNDRTILSGKILSGDGASHDRLVQHETPKLILQCMIGVMIAGGVLAVTTMQLINLLPSHGNPCTIWGQMSLWLTSDCCANECTTKAGMIAKPTLVKHSFSQPMVVETSLQEQPTQTRYQLGWWTIRQMDGGFRRRYGIDTVRDDSES